MDSLSWSLCLYIEDLLVYCGVLSFTLLLNAKGYYLVIYDDSNGYWNTGGSVSLTQPLGK